MLKKWHQHGLASHFPEQIPAYASNVRLSACPGSFQGGAWFQIRFNLPPEKIAGLYEQATKQAKAFYDGGDMFTLVNSRKGGLPGTNFHTSELKRSTSVGSPEFPGDYRIFVFDAQPSEPSGEPHWNHGTSRGVVLSRDRNEVIYYAELW